jgi:spore germination protein
MEEVTTEHLGCPCTGGRRSSIERMCRGRLVVYLAMIAILASCRHSYAAEATHPAAAKTVLAYYEVTDSKAALMVFHRHIDELSTDTYNIDSAGNLSGSIPDDAIGFASGHHIASYLAISNWGRKDFSAAIVHTILGSPAAQAKAIENILSALSAHGYAGVNIDFESVPASDRGRFSSFLGSLAQRIHASGFKLIVSVPAEQADNPSDAWTGAFDYRAIAKASDLVQLMTYDEHGPWGPPGAVAGDDWVLETVKFATTVVPKQKVSLGLPAYGYDWNLTAKTGVQVHWNEIPSLLSKTRTTPQRDLKSNAPHFSYTAADGARHEVWYEDAVSIAAKAGYAVTFDLKGVNEFALGFENQEFWDAVCQGLDPH